MRGGGRHGSQRLMRDTRHRDISAKARPAPWAAREDEERRGLGGPCALLPTSAPPPPYSLSGTAGPRGSRSGELRPDHLWGTPGAERGQEEGRQVCRQTPARASRLLPERAREPMRPTRATPRAPPSLQSFQPSVRGSASQAPWMHPAPTSLSAAHKAAHPRSSQQQGRGPWPGPGSCEPRRASSKQHGLGRAAKAWDEGLKPASRCRGRRRGN